MRKILIFTLSLLLLLSACRDSASDPEAVNKLSEAVAATNSETRFSGQYMLEISFGKGVTLYYALGNVNCDRALKTANASFSQTYLGVSGNAENYISDGKVISIDSGEYALVEVESDALFKRFPYCEIYKLPEQTEVTVTENMQGTSYRFINKDTKNIFETVVGGDIYELVTVLKQPQKDKTEYGETECIYTVEDGRVVAIRYEFDMKLYDTPAYVPDYSVPESDYTVELHIVAKLTYKNFGSSVEINEYSAAESEISS